MTTRSDSLASSLLLVVGLAVFQRSLGFVREILFCRWLDQEQLGTWAMAFVFLMSASAIASLGVQGSMNRYLEYYRQRGGMRRYLARVTAVSVLLAIVAGSAMMVGCGWFAELIFGDRGETGLVSLLAIGLVIVMANHFVIEFFSATRLFRICSLLHFANSFGFVVSSIALMALWQTKAESLIVAFVATYFVVWVGFAVYAFRVAKGLPVDTAPLSNREFWPKLARFSCALWVYNCLANLFEATDRYMILHFSNLDPIEALSTVGTYHSVRVVPLLLASVSALIATTLMPHQSHDWELGRRRKVAFRQRLTLKLVGLGLLAAAAIVMLAAPLLFNVLLQGKYSAGREVLASVLATCIWSGLAAVAFNYLWCLERLRVCSVTLTVALIMNIALNALLIPIYGLWGAVVATAAAHLVQVLIIYLLSSMEGLRLDLSMWVITLAPALLLLGPMAAVAMVFVLGMFAIRGTMVLQHDERRQIAIAWARGVDRIAAFARNSSFLQKIHAIVSPLRYQSVETATIDRPLRVMFIITSMPVGGAETLLVNLVRRLDPKRFSPDICCLKDPGPLGEEISDEIPVFCNLLSGRFDLRVWPRLKNLITRRKIDAVVTVGAGDKMFWGRLVACRAGVPVIVSALHSTGWPDGVGRLNRRLTPMTDAFIAVANPHGEYLRDAEGFPADKIHVIVNGVDTDRFKPTDDLAGLRCQLGLSTDAPTVGIVAALRPEKNHALLLQAIKQVRDRIPDVRLLIVGDGPEREGLVALANSLDLEPSVQFLGNRDDVDQIVSVVDVFALTSHVEANPVSILEAMSCGKPVVSTDVGSVSETVRDGVTGYLVTPGDVEAVADRLIELLENPQSAQQMGHAARRCVVADWSIRRMVAGYEDLLGSLYTNKTGRRLPEAPEILTGDQFSLCGAGDLDGASD